MVKAITGVAAADVEGFVASLTQASVTLGGIPARLEAARVHDVAFGKLVDAAKVRDAYHSRLPATEQNITEARELIAHIIAQFGGEPVPDPEPIYPVTVPGQGVPGAGSESVVPEQAGTAQAAPESAVPGQTEPESAVLAQADLELAVPGPIVLGQTEPGSAVLAQADPELAVPEPTAPALIAPESVAPDPASLEQPTSASDPDPDPVTALLPGPRTGQTTDG